MSKWLKSWNLYELAAIYLTKIKFLGPYDIYLVLFFIKICVLN